MHAARLIGRVAWFLRTRGGPGSCIDEAEEVVAGLFAALVERDYAQLRTYRGDSTLATWLSVAAIRRAQNHLRAEGRESARRLRLGELGPREAEEPDPLGGLEREEAVRLVERAAEGLPARDRLILRLHFVEGLPRAETARRLRVSLNSVTALASRAVSRLRELLE